VEPKTLAAKRNMGTVLSGIFSYKKHTSDSRAKERAQIRYWAIFQIHENHGKLVHYRWAMRHMLSDDAVRTEF